MFGRAFHIGNILGFRIEISVSFLVLLAVILLTQGVAAGALGILGGLLMVVVLFGSVLLHELGHAVVARRLGIQILGIELHFIGGAAKMGQPPRSARDEIVIAVAGPAVSFVLGAVSYGLSLATGVAFFGLLALINLVLGVFNLLPALPMDGGRVLRAMLSERMGRYRATHVAATVAQSLAVGLVLLGVVQYARPLIFISGIPLSGLALIIVAVLVWVLAGQERAMAGRWRYADEAPATQVIDSEGRIISGFEGGGPVSEGSTHASHAPPGQVMDGAKPGGPSRRVYRLPNGTVVVVEEYVRW